MNFIQARDAMIDGQLRPNDVSDPVIVRAFRNVPREAYVDANAANLAYGERPVALGHGRHLWSPMDTGKLLAATRPTASDMVLVVGSGTGYEAALYSHLCEFVIALEDQAELANASTDILSAGNVKNVTVVEGDLLTGAADQGPFDIIFVCGSVEDVADAWLDQLADGGRLAVVQAAATAPFRAQIHHKTGNLISKLDVFECVVPKFDRFNRAKYFAF